MPDKDEFVMVPKAALDWLLGEGPAPDGRWFGDDEDTEIRKPRKYSAKYWWRSRFQSMLSNPHGEIKTGNAVGNEFPNEPTYPNGMLSTRRTEMTNTALACCSTCKDPTPCHQSGCGLPDNAMRLRDVLERIERGATSVLLDASLKNSPISPDVLHQIVKDIRSALPDVSDGK